MKRSQWGTICTTDGCKQKKKPAQFLSGTGALQRRTPLCASCAAKARRISNLHEFPVHLHPIAKEARRDLSSR